jgi:hypothetical protein
MPSGRSGPSDTSLVTLGSITQTSRNPSPASRSAVSRRICVTPSAFTSSARPDPASPSTSSVTLAISSGSSPGRVAFTVMMPTTISAAAATAATGRSQRRLRWSGPGKGTTVVSSADPPPTPVTGGGVGAVLVGAVPVGSAAGVWPTPNASASMRAQRSSGGVSHSGSSVGRPRPIARSAARSSNPSSSDRSWGSNGSDIGFTSFQVAT